MLARFKVLRDATYTKGKIVGNSGTGLEDSDIHGYVLGRLGFKNM